MRGGGSEHVRLSVRVVARATMQLQAIEHSGRRQTGGGGGSGGNGNNSGGNDEEQRQAVAHTPHVSSCES